MKKRFIVLITALLMITCICSACTGNTDTQSDSNINSDIVGPKVPVKGEYDAVVQEALNSYHESQYSYLRGMQESYGAFGDYLKFSSNRDYTRKQFKMDDQGIPMARYDNVYYYNPVTVSQYVLCVHGKYLKDRSYKNIVISAAEKLLSMQGEDGAFRYEFDFYYYLTEQTMPAGWVSAMAQGQAISALVRTYDITGDKKYLRAAEKAYEFMNIPVEQGGTKATLKDLYAGWDNYIIYEEYISEPMSYTLNGFMYTMLGIYDLSQTKSAVAGNAAQMFDECMKTLKLILPYFDVGGFTCYDLGYITFDRQPHISVSYHSDHIFLLQALINITGDKKLAETRDLYISYVGAEEPKKDSTV